MSISFIENAVNIGKEIERINEKHYNVRRGSRHNFNFFEGIVRVNKHHEKYHSNFIAYLINPNSSHDCGTFFLKKFLNQIQEKIKPTNSNFSRLLLKDIEKVHVEREIDSIDISIKKDSEWIIFIENKVRHNERDNQLEDYYSLCKDKFSEVVGIFLTKDGRKPTSINEEQKNIFCLSYEDNILNWLKCCITDLELLYYPNIVTSLIQYSQILKQELNIMENKEAIEIKEYFEKDVNVVISLLKNKKEINNAFDLIDEIIKQQRMDFLENVTTYVKAQLLTVENLKFKNEIRENKENWRHEIKLFYSFKTFDFIFDIELNYPDYEDGGRGLWWGIYEIDNKQIEWNKLENSCWDSFTINGIKDYWDSDSGSLKIINAFANKEYAHVIQDTSEQILHLFKSNVLKFIQQKLTTDPSLSPLPYPGKTPA